MRATTQRLFSVCVLICFASAIGFILAVIFQWPSEFVLSEVTEHNVTLADIMSGTVTSIPLVPWAALVVFALLARSRRWWGTLAVVVLCLLGGIFIIGGLGEASTLATPYVSRAVLVSAGVIYVLLGLSLILFGIADLIDRYRMWRQPPRMN